eukprot:TRINITY_DN5978_c0_g1_i4.p2 TRINITY_DN5978_c0_g1~~TRINITY_DN5978_c0_g1_i4.p2  ORF type:complete len:348 (+),score=38.11 TRINITY_DN5978_c0_g1_i4:1108-2151(+)
MQRGRYDTDSQFTVFDFAVAGSDNRVIPMGVDVQLKNNAYCGIINNIANNTVFFLVLRDSASDWADQPVTYLSKGEQIYMAIIGTIYILVSFWTVLATYWNWNKVLWLMYVFLMVFLGWRGIHLLVLAGSMGTIQSPGLSEPPIFFYFLTVSVLAVMYQVVRTVSDKSKHKNTMLVANVIISLILFSILLVVIFVSVFVKDTDLYLRECYSRIDLGIKPWPSQKIVSLVYLCVLGILSTLFGFAILFSGFKLQQTLNEGSKMKVSSTEKTSNKYFFLAMLLCTSIICLANQLIIFGNITQTRGIVYLRLTLLWFFEIPSPIALLFYSTIQQGPKDNTKTTATSTARG